MASCVKDLEGEQKSLKKTEILKEKNKECKN